MSLKDDEYFDDPKPEIRNRSRLRNTLIPIAAVALLFLGNSLAANISLGSGKSEFGQGFLATTACSGGSQISISPSSFFINSAGSGAFVTRSITLTGIPSSCYGVQFLLQAYDSATATPLALFGNNQSDIYFANSSGTYLNSTGSNGITVITNSASSVTLFLTIPRAFSNQIQKITLQSMPYIPITTSMCTDALASTANTSVAVSNGTCVITFTSGTNTFTAPAGVKSVTVLVVGGGGGGGGGAFGGGGGAGGLIYNENFATTPGTGYSISVGAGGSGGTASISSSGSGYVDNAGDFGGNSNFGSVNVSGGGGGGGYVSPTANMHTIDTNSNGIAAFNATVLSNASRDASIGNDGGSGGGTSENSYHRSNATLNQGNKGGTPLLLPSISWPTFPYTYSHAGAGGGGAGGAGQDVTATDTPGDGGVGISNSISGSAVYYAGGGGGGTDNSSGTRTASGGNGGGGAGGKSGNGGNGTANTGGGGGGAGFNPSARAGGNGGSGVVILRFNP